MSITLTNSVRSNLLALQNISSEMSITQNRISTGLKVSSPMDNPTSYFISQNLLNRANDLSSIADNLLSATTSLQTAIDGLSNIAKILQQMQGVATSAQSSSSTIERISYAKQYDSLIAQLNNLTNDTSFNGTNLLKANPDTLNVTLNEKGSSYAVQGIASDATGLNINTNNDWANATITTGTTNITNDLTTINNALTIVRTNSSTFGSNLSFIKTRSSFTTSIINDLKSGSADLINADTNEESVKLQALNLRQNLAIQALQLTNTASQQILTLFK